MVETSTGTFVSPGMIRRKASTPERANSHSPKRVGETDSRSTRTRSKQSPASKVRRNVFYSLAAISVTIAACKVLCREPSATTLSSTAHAISSQSTGQASLERHSPVTVLLGGTAYDQVRRALPMKLKENSWLGEEWANQECVPMHKWQLPEYGPFSCNIMHERNMADVMNTGLTIINCGGSRCAFEINDDQGIPMVVKMPR